MSTITIMRLFHIDKPGCHHITELMDGIKAVYQLEQEFYPYLTVEFLPHKDQPAGIILLTKTQTIRKNYTFDDPNDINDLRKLIWKYMVEDYNILDITKNGCLTDFREIQQPNIVIQGWQAKKRMKSKEVCCKEIGDGDEEVNNKVNTKPIRTFEDQQDALGHKPFLHEVYRLDPTDKQNRNICKKVRGGECGDNYPSGSATYKRCMDEVQWLCDNGYPENKRVDAMNKLVSKTRTDAYNYLKNNNMKVDKLKFDAIADAGLFQDMGNRAGNKVSDYKEPKKVFDNMNDNILLDRIEGFDGGLNQNVVRWILVVLCIIFVIGCVLNK